MIVLNAAPDLKLTFSKLIQTMEVQVNWNGLFVVIDNTLILQGDVRSLFFHFDSRKVVTNIIDLDIPVEKITPVADNPYVKNILNMLLYAFGKWGNIKGLTVEKDYRQLSRMFSGILGELEIESDYNREHFWFYQKGVRIVYEDVVQCAIEFTEKEQEAPEGESRGLWHRLIWKQTYKDFTVQETNAKERNRNRLGNNFYLTGYQCPECKNGLHAVVYPVGKEFVIETQEGDVRIARAYTCAKCCSFYTPRPMRLLIDGDCYIMDFMGDKAAYEDYQELLGRDGDKVSNYNYNEYVDRRKAGGADGVRTQKAAEEQSLKEFRETLDEIDEIPNREFERFFGRIAERFFPEKEVEQVEKTLWKKHEARQRGEKTAGSIRDYEKVRRDKKAPGNKEENTGTGAEKTKRYEARLNLFPRLSERQRRELVKQISSDEMITERVREELLETAKELTRQDNYEKLKEKIAGAKNKNRLVMLRIYGEIENAGLKEPERKKLFDLTGLSRAEYQEYLAETDGETPAKEYKMLKEEGTVKEEKPVKKEGTIKERKPVKEERTVKERKPVKNERAIKEEKSVREEGTVKEGRIVKSERAIREEKPVKKEGTVKKERTVNKDVGNREIAKSFVRDSKALETGMKAPVDRTAINKAADIREIEAMIRGVRADSREELQQLLDSLFEQDFNEEIVESYEKQIKEKIQKLDEEYLDSILGSLMNLSSEDGVAAYEEIKEAQLLPELKANALNQLEKRLKKIKADECELLVQKLQKEMAEAGITEPDRHHYYPAKRVITKEAAEEEVEVIHYARDSYGAGMGPFEYPIWAVDTSFNRSGDKGMFLTPEHIYYSTLTTSYHISVFAVDHIEASVGLLNRGIIVHQKNEKKTKLPYAVDTSELPKLAAVLDSFVKYLQEKPFSRKEVYLAKETHEEICCYRCGHIYRGTDTCPKCGYKTNR